MTEAGGKVDWRVAYLRPSHVVVTGVDLTRLVHLVSRHPH